MPLLREFDGEDYQAKKFNQMRVNNFKFYIVTQSHFPPEELIDKTFPIRVLTGEVKEDVTQSNNNLDVKPLSRDRAFTR